MKNPFLSDVRITQIFGPHAALASRYRERFGMLGHNGLDLVPTGPTWGVHALLPGRVVRDWDQPSRSGWGNTVSIFSPEHGVVLLYAHFSENVVDLGDWIEEGDLVGIMGSTGDSTGAHLHLGAYPCDSQVRKTEPDDNGYFGAVDPMRYLT